MNVERQLTERTVRETMNLASIFASAFVVGLSGAMMPGSLLVVNISETSRRGLRGGMLAVTGHAMLELMVVAGFAFGLGGVLSRRPVAGTIGLAGSVMLAWMAYGTIKAAWSAAAMPVAGGRRRPVPASEADPDLRGAGGPSGARGDLASLAAGGLATVSNPYWTLWWATIGATLVGLALQQGRAASAAFYAGHVSSDFAWYFLVSLIMVTGRRLLSDAVYRAVLLVCGCFLVVLAVYFALAGIIMLSG
ncbi:MAG: LysE family transporter [Betaproteobacteria bacterium]